MKKIRLSALALTGAMVLTLAACSSKEPEATPTPEPTITPNVVESIAPSETPEAVSPDPEPSESTNIVTPPAETDAVVKPLETQKPVQTAPIETEPAPTEAPSGTSKVQAVWEAIATRELPFFDDSLDDQILADFYGIDPADLVEYVWKMPFMNTQATEFFIAQVQPDKMDTVKAALENRQAALEEQWSQYLPDQLELVKNYKLVTNGDYIMFAVTEYADEVVTEFNTYTK